MNISKILKLAPNGILVAFLAYACVSLHGELPDSAATKAELAKGLDQMMLDISTDSAAVLNQAQLRDPFLVAAPPAAAAEAARTEEAANPEADPLAHVVAGLHLDATFVQGRDQFAIIDGRTYNKGQRLAHADDASRPPLVVLFVKPMSVILRGGGKNYVLGYPDTLVKKAAPDKDAASNPESSMLDPAGQFALFQKLLGSPLGALGQSLIAVPGAYPAGVGRGTTRKPARTR